MRKRLAIVNSDPMNWTYGGVAPFMKNMDPYFREVFEVDYFYLPRKWERVPGPNRIKTFLFLLLCIPKLKKYDFILSHIPEGSYIASITGVPYAHIYHGNSNPMTVSRFKMGKHFAFIYKYFFNRISKTATIQYSVGPTEGAIRKLLNPITHSVQTKPIDERSGFIYAGRLESPKNIDRIIRVYAQLPESIREKNDLFIAGTGSQEEKLIQLVREIHLEKKIHFLGRMDNERLIEEDSTHLLFLMASAIEGMPTAIAEALSVGLPVICLAAGDIPLVIRNGENGYALPIDCCDVDFIDAILNSLNNIEPMSRQALRSADIFNSRVITQSMINDILNA